MNESYRFLPIFILQFVAFCSFSCSSGELLEDMVLSTPPPPDSVEVKKNDIIRSDSLGRINAIKKAYQMTDIEFTLQNNIKANKYKEYKAGETYKGLIYSSAKELEAFIGNDVSIYTFMTAIHNPRSLIYTEDISEPPYHGLNCKSYYGTVCSSFVSHALGIVPRYWANDFPLSDVMQEVASSNPDSVEIADVLWRDGHVAMITDIIKDNDNRTEALEISESVEKGCRRYIIRREKFPEMMNTSFKKVYRYTELYKNTDYVPYPEFVTVLDENPAQFVYNDFLCSDKGDKACYREDEAVTINIFHDYEYLEVYKDDKPYLRIDNNSIFDVVLQNLPYGDYKATICYGTNHDMSDYTYWKVVNINVAADRTSGRIYFSSANAIPQCVRYCDIHGSGGSLTTSNLHLLSEKEKNQGYIDILSDEIKQKFPYVRVNFVTDYGRIINKPIKWFE